MISVVNHSPEEGNLYKKYVVVHESQMISFLVSRSLS